VALGVHDAAEGDARGIVDSDMDELTADAAIVALASAVASDAMADLVESAEFLDVDVDEFAGVFALVAAWRLGRFQGAQSIEPQAPQDATDGGCRDAGVDGDRLAGQTLAAQRLDPDDDGLGRRLTQPMGS